MGRPVGRRDLSDLALVWLGRPTDFTAHLFCRTIPCPLDEEKMDTAKLPSVDHRNQPNLILC